MTAKPGRNILNGATTPRPALLRADSPALTADRRLLDRWRSARWRTRFNGAAVSPTTADLPAAVLPEQEAEHDSAALAAVPFFTADDWLAEQFLREARDLMEAPRRWCISVTPTDLVVRTFHMLGTYAETFARAAVLFHPAVIAVEPAGEGPETRDRRVFVAPLPDTEKQT